MLHDHLTHPRMLSDRLLVGLVGAGGNGSQMLSGLARLNQAIRALGHPGLDVIVWDPDDVSEANLGRQLYAPADVGRNKATVLVTRINAWFGTNWTAVPHNFKRAPEGDINIVVSCVDSARSRVAIGETIKQQGRGSTYYWLDLGNRAADGQVVLGIPPWNEDHAAYTFRLPTVLELFPELRTSEEVDPGPSCSLAQALERQELFVNQAVVTPALQLLWLLFRYGRTNWCGAFMNLTTGRMTPLPVDPEAWKRFGHHTNCVRARMTVSSPTGEQVWIEKDYPQNPELRARLEAEAREEAEH